jgi:DNA-binding phage protein
MPKKTSSYRSWQLEKLKDPQIAASYLRGALEDSPETFLQALEKVAQAHQAAKDIGRSGAGKESNRKASGNGSSRSSVLSVLTSVGLRLSIEPLGSTPHRS